MDQQDKKYRGFFSYLGEGICWFLIFIGIGFGIGSCTYLMQIDARKPLIIIEHRK
jgi:hypothetical protein